MSANTVYVLLVIVILGIVVTTTSSGRRGGARQLRRARHRLIDRPTKRIKRRLRDRYDRTIAFLRCVRSWDWTRDQVKTQIRRQHNRRRAERVIGRWSSLTDESPYLAGSRARLHAVDGFGWTLLVRLRRGVVVPAIAGLGRSIETLLHARRDTIRVDPGTHTDEIVVFHLVLDPLRTTGRHVAAPKPVTIDVGLFDTGEPVLLPIDHHTLIAGRTGAGKSGLLNTIIAKLAALPHNVFRGIDMKGGVEFRNWASIFELAPAFTIEAAEELLRDTVAEMERRQSVMAGRWWNVTVDGPRLFVLVDEMAELANSKKATEALRTIARRGRATGVILILSTQYPTTGDKIIPAQVRANITNTICMRVERPDHIGVVFGNDGLRGGWNTADFDPTMPGLMKVRSTNYTRPRRARARWLDDGEIIELARRHARRPVDQETRGGDVQPPPASPLAASRASTGTTPPVPVMEPLEARILTALRAHPAGLSRSDLATLVGGEVSSSAVYRRLRKLREEQAVTCDAKGGMQARWTAVAGTVTGTVNDVGD